MWWRLQLALPAEQREVDEGFRRDAGSESGERRWMRELFRGYTYTVEESESLVVGEEMTLPLKRTSGRAPGVGKQS